MLHRFLQIDLNCTSRLNQLIKIYFTTTVVFVNMKIYTYDCNRPYSSSFCPKWGRVRCFYGYSSLLTVVVKSAKSFLQKENTLQCEWNTQQALCCFPHNSYWNASYTGTELLARKSQGPGISQERASRLLWVYLLEQSCTGQLIELQSLIHWVEPGYFSWKIFIEETTQRAFFLL